MILKADRYI